MAPDPSDFSGTASSSSSRQCADRRRYEEGRSEHVSKLSLAALAFAAASRSARCGRQFRSPFVGGASVAQQRMRSTMQAFKSDRQTRVRLSDDLPAGVDFYEVLGVDKFATQDEIRTAYKRVIKETHPDVNPSPEAAEQFIRVQEAFRWLSDPQQREVYDGVGSKFGQDAIYDYTDEPILGSLSEIRDIEILLPATEIVNRCRKAMTFKRGVTINHEIKDIRRRFRVFGAERLQFVRNYICGELKKVLRYPELIRRLHPFERVSVELALTHHRSKEGVTFGEVMSCLKYLRHRVSEECNHNISSCNEAERGRLATFIADEGIEAVFDLVQSYEPIFQQFIGCQRAIFRTPCIDLDKPTVVFVGAPNVGKSSLVRSLSTGRPEVNDYAYTTKQLTIGHLWHFIAGTPLLIHGQIVDSPGLGSGPDGNHNLMDSLTMGSMMHLPTGVVFVFDPDPYTHGLLDIEQQIELRETLRKKFPRRPWLDVITKLDLEDEKPKENMETLLRRYPDAIQVSALEGDGLDTLNMQVRGLLEEMTRVVRQLQRSKIRHLRMGEPENNTRPSKEALSLRAVQPAM
eukprot:TRINITY_DN111064_c0_g1_i1.p1 TRINITY_DN111064_c0_g1~~TRINITY_DN111064_c0_g1_i1.p1  ORF type:complete len:621 (+),score=97.63 TRINITY_DN111064_c0_g1_i1:145-1863(+)